MRCVYMYICIVYSIIIVVTERCGAAASRGVRVAIVRSWRVDIDFVSSDVINDGVFMWLLMAGVDLAVERPER